MVDPTASTSLNRVKICLRSSNGKRMEMYVFVGSTVDGYMIRRKVATKASVDGSIETINATLLLGAGYNTSSVVANYSKGTIHDIKVYNTAISNWEIADYMGWNVV